MFGSVTISVVLAGLLLAACGESEQAAKPPPQDLTRDAIGHYCQMIIADHRGPKAQIILTDRDAPVWFSSVRDAIAFTLLPDEPKNIAAVYVNDMAKASWDAPEPDTWIDAETAHFVIGSERRGGMGALEAVPFGDVAKAEAFMAQHGGRIVVYTEIPSDYVLNAEAEASATHDSGAHDNGAMDGQETMESHELSPQRDGGPANHQEAETPHVSTH
jgi:copper chaperone NosL